MGKAILGKSPSVSEHKTLYVKWKDGSCKVFDASYIVAWVVYYFFVLSDNKCISRIILMLVEYVWEYTE